MILVDTSVWIDHLRAADAHLSMLLRDVQVMVHLHPFVVGELALGDMRQREAILGLLQAMPAAPVAEQGEMLAFISDNNLAGTGIGFIDSHLLASVRLASGSQLWTRDERLLVVAEGMKLAYQPRIRSRFYSSGHPAMASSEGVLSSLSEP